MVSDDYDIGVVVAIELSQAVEHPPYLVVGVLQLQQVPLSPELTRSLGGPPRAQEAERMWVTGVTLAVRKDLPGHVGQKQVGEVQPGPAVLGLE